MNNLDRFHNTVGLEDKISYIFKNKSLLREALTHSSYSHEKGLSYSYERLEFLGDAVLALIVSEYILNNYKNFDEGYMSQLRAYVVNEKFLSQAAKRIDLSQYVFLGKGESICSLGTDSILADIFEALIAAIYLDGGYAIVSAIVMSLFKQSIEAAVSEGVFLDEKGEIQKFSQKEYGILPVYTIIKEEGPDHNKIFTVRLDIGGVLFSEGVGKSKKMAEKSAATAMLSIIYKG